jgi:glycosyltransferase involved in cell wall biosynthesis
VDDASTDGTYEFLAERLAKLTITYKLEALKVNSHQAYCRNHGVKAFNTKYIMFCDSDDEWFPNHIAQTYDAITAKDSHGRDICLVSTGVYTAPELQVHPEWAPRISSTIPFNKMMRRELFDFIEGFPCNDIYKKTGCEDQSFMQIADRFFHVLSVNTNTVQYHNYKGSFFDKQLPKFRLHPFFMALAPEPGAAEKMDLHKAINDSVNEKIEYLKKKLTYLDLNEKMEMLCTKFI